MANFIMTLDVSQVKKELNDIENQLDRIIKKKEKITQNINITNNEIGANIDFDKFVEKLTEKFIKDMERVR